MIRPTVDSYFMSMVDVVSTRGSCMRRKTGCILVDKHKHVMATGYNGRPRGFKECLHSPCEGAVAGSGTQLDKCEAIHAEANALLQCNDVESIDTAYCTTAPCIHCAKLLLNTGCRRVMYRDEYPHMETVVELFSRAGVKLEKWI